MPMTFDPSACMSLERNPRARLEAERVPSDSGDPLEQLIALEEELGCSIVQAVHRYRQLMREQRTVDAH